jgi:hypothetical protein
LFFVVPLTTPSLAAEVQIDEHHGVFISIERR